MGTSKNVETSSTAGATEKDPTVQGAQDDQATIPSSTTMTVDEKRARKRQLDRISQRRKRQKDRETMDRLKKSLERPHDPTVLHSLLLKQEEDLARSYRHNQRMLQIQAIVEADLADVNKDKPGGQPSPPSDDSYDSQQGTIEAIPSQAQVGIEPIDTTTISLPQESQIDLDGFSWDDSEVAPVMEQPLLSSCITGAPDVNSYFDMLPILSNDTSSVNLGIFSSPFDYPNEPAAMVIPDKVGVTPITRQERSCGKCGSVWKGANMNISLARRQHCLSKAQTYGSHDADSDAHMIITAIAEGWSAAEQSPFWSAAWEHLRNIDQLCHRMSGDVERLVILYNLRRMMKHLRFPRDGMADLVPRFLHERPSQLSVPHPVVIDYFVWPGFREHVIFNHQRYCNNDFSDLYSVSIKFLWPYEVRDTYVRNRQTNLYHFSRAFLDQADDLRCYTLDLEFFRKYPEFRGDAPVYESLPKICASIHTCEPTWQHFPPSQRQGLLLSRGGQHDQVEDVQDSVVI